MASFLCHFPIRLVSSASFFFHYQSLGGRGYTWFVYLVGEFAYKAGDYDAREQHEVDQ